MGRWKGCRIIGHPIGRYGVGLVLACSVLTTQATQPASANERYASIVLDAEDMSVLHARNADALRFPASLTKVMTLYMVFDALEAGQLSLSDRIVMSKTAASRPPSKLGLPPGSSLSVEDAIKALVAKSANDVAAALGERLGGSEGRFAALMTVKARSLGMSDTRFRNASGLPDQLQKTTARDMARLADALLIEHKAFYDYFGIKHMDWHGRRLANHNRLLSRVDGVDGIKTGYTRASGFNLMASAQRAGRRVIAIVMGGPSARARDDHMAALLEAAFDEIERAPTTSLASVRGRYTEDQRVSFADNSTEPSPFGEGSVDGDR